jgi:hypothetical protein
MGKITVDLAAMYPQTFGDKDAMRRAALGEQLQQAQLQNYQEADKLREQTQQRQVLPFEDFKVNVGGDDIPFKALPPEQKMQWAKQRQIDWELQQSTNYTKYQADKAKAETELEANLQKKKDIQSARAGMMGGEKPGPDFLPGALFGAPYNKQEALVGEKIKQSEQAIGRAGLRLQSLQGQEMPQSYGMPSVVKPSQQQPAVQTQPQAQGQAQQAVPTYKSRDEAIQSGAKAGDFIYIPGVGKVRLR